ncbi:hypothetical protein R1flu_025407 [Riccia fluitans]|uniref:GCK domain-containing protein n=1 Tax=Riccia fluitans TaxID=41844 RepID=A0ABD1XXN6_9MARC
MTEGSDEGDEEKSISTEVEEDERTDAENTEENDDTTLERLEDQLEDCDLIGSHGDDGVSLKHESNSEEERRQDEDCPFCEYMRLGPCGESFTAWEKCTEAAEHGGSDVFEKCNFVTGALTACMRGNKSYYGPVLEAQRVTNDNLQETDESLKFEQDSENASNNTEEQLDIQDQAREADD